MRLKERGGLGQGSREGKTEREMKMKRGGQGAEVWLGHGGESREQRRSLDRELSRWEGLGCSLRLGRKQEAQMWSA